MLAVAGIPEAELASQVFPYNEEIRKVGTLLTALRRQKPLTPSWWDAVNVCFGNTTQGLKAAGVRLRQPRYADGPSVIAEIHRRLKAGKPINSNALINGEQHDRPLILAAQKFFGPWSKALEKAGITDEQRQRHLKRVAMSPEGVIAAIQKRVDKGEPIHGGSAVPHSLYHYAKSHFGSWDGALIAAGGAPEFLRAEAKRKRLRFPDADAVLEGIRRRHREGRSIDADSLVNGKAGNKMLYLSGAKFFGSWREALIAAGFPAPVRRVLPLPITREGVLEVYRQFAAQEPGDGYQCHKCFCERAAQVFGSWVAMLVAAGVPKEQVALQRFPYHKKIQTVEAVLSMLRKGERMPAIWNTAARACLGACIWDE